MSSLLKLRTRSSTHMCREGCYAMADVSVDVKRNQTWFFWGSLMVQSLVRRRVSRVSERTCFNCSSTSCTLWFETSLTRGVTQKTYELNQNYSNSEHCRWIRTQLSPFIMAQQLNGESLDTKNGCHLGKTSTVDLCWYASPRWSSVAVARSR